ncbi:MAG: hypothetical protein JW870_13535 [Candidatus Delongbacteria bacterium]|nr:hypothetical protein [Candidatus Delongbacteria bacterium]
MKYLQKLIKSPETLSLLILAIVISFLSYNTSNLVKTLFLLIFISISCEYIITKFFKTDTDFNINNISFALIIFLITNVKLDIFLSIFTVILTHFLSHIVKYKNQQVFNNISLGLFTLSLFGLNTNWWGVNVSIIVLLSVIILGLVDSYLKRQLKIIFLFFLFIVSFNLILTVNPLYSIKQVFVPGFLFFSFFILTKNVSIFTQKQKTICVYLILTAFFSVIIPKFGFFTDPLITSAILSDFIIFTKNLLFTRHLQQ